MQRKTCSSIRGGHSCRLRTRVHGLDGVCTVRYRFAVVCINGLLARQKKCPRGVKTGISGTSVSMGRLTKISLVGTRFVCFSVLLQSDAVRRCILLLDLHIVSRPRQYEGVFPAVHSQSFLPREPCGGLRITSQTCVDYTVVWTEEVAKEVDDYSIDRSLLGWSPNYNATSRSMIRAVPRNYFQMAGDKSNIVEFLRCSSVNTYCGRCSTYSVHRVKRTVFLLVSCFG